MIERKRGQETSLYFPQRFVERYGAKAGMLLYVAERLPDIPQVPMVVNEPGEDIDSFLARADRSGVGWPRFFRSSAAAELLGYEGQFPTEYVDDFTVGNERVSWNPNNYSIYRNKEYFDNGIRRIVNEIQNSPQQFKREGLGQDLPDEINVIIAEKAPSRYVGTYIKHPNQEGVFLITITADATRNLHGGPQDPDRTSYLFSQEMGLQESKGYSLDHLEGESIEQGLATVISWHDQIAALPDIDPRWSYQIEFGIDPPVLFQVRPFKPLQKATFRLKSLKDEAEVTTPIVIGTTTSRGLMLKVVDSDSDITEEECIFIDDMKVAWTAEEFPNLRVNLLKGSHGFLEHNDVRAMRRAQVTALYSVYPFYGVEPGDRVKIKSDGTRLRVTKSKEVVERERRLHKASDFLYKFTRKNYKAIRALRSACQLFEQRPPHGTPERTQLAGQLREIGAFVTKESGDVLHWPDSGSLCQITDDCYLMQHTGIKTLDKPLEENSRAVRGFYFCIEFEGVDYQCFELDPGNSREYWNQMSRKERLKFMRTFGEEVRKINAAGDTHFPSGFVTFVSDIEDGYGVEEIAQVGNDG